MRRLLASTCVAVVGYVAASAAAQAATIVFSEDFNGLPSALNASNLGGFKVTGGSVDVIPLGSAFNFLPGNGKYVDLDGSTPNTAIAGQLTSTTSFGPGTYTVSFDLAGNQRVSGDRTTTVSLGGVTNSYTLPTFAALTTYSFNVTLTTASSLVFTETGKSTFRGNILDNVTVSTSMSPVPLPASLPMFGGALLALAGFGYGMSRRVAPKTLNAIAAV